MIKSIFRVSLLALTAASPALAQDDPAMLTAMDTITAANIRADIATLASPAFEGRGPGGVGEEMTVSFISGQFAEAGISPAINGSFMQAFELTEFRPDGPGDMSISGPDGDIPFELADDYVIYGGQPAERLIVENSRVVIGGFGIRADEESWDDYEGVDLTGATVILFRGDPGTATGDETLFDGNALTVHGLIGSKIDLAAELGAEAILLVHTPESAGYPWTSLSSGGGGNVQYSLQDGDPDVSIFAHISEPTARRLMEITGLDYDEVYAAASAPGFTAIETELTADGEKSGSVSSTMTRNVVGMIEGSEAPDECLVYTAHWDHMGINPNAPTDDHLFNGALDNATGTSMLINIARAYASLPEAPRRSVYFFATAAEERGLYGAEYFVDNSPCELRNIVGALNMDAHFPYSDHWGLMVVPGLGTNDLHAGLESAAERFGRYLVDDPNPAAGGFYRSDHYPFIAAGVPGLFAVGAPTEEQAVADDRPGRGFGWYMANGYHHAADEIDQPFVWRLGGIAEDAKVFFELGWQLSNSDTWPNFAEGTPWRAMRDEMRAEE